MKLIGFYSFIDPFDITDEYCAFGVAVAGSEVITAFRGFYGEESSDNFDWFIATFGEPAKYLIHTAEEYKNNNFGYYEFTADVQHICGKLLQREEG